MLKGKTVVLGVSGGISAYKMANIASKLVKLHADVHVIMTKNACNFINPITFETLTKNKCITDTFDRNFEFNVEHVSLAKKCDLFLVAPATANIIGKMANGICDDMLTTTIFACKAPKLVAPAMNTNMYQNPILKDNLKKLEGYGFKIINPESGFLACGDEGEGRLPSDDVLIDSILAEIAFPHDLEGKKVLITAGPTKEAIDPVRYITNHSSGKMGYAIANNAYLRGANVTLISGDVNVKAINGINVVFVKSALDMFEAVKNNYKNQDYIIMSAAIADYTPKSYSNDKIKKNDNDMIIELSRTQDILKYLGENKKDNQKLIGFSMETKDLIENSTLKLSKKNADMICANSINGEKTGFKSDTNEITLIKRDGNKLLSLDTKENLAKLILDEIKGL
ncbi:MAG: bifunctional phosphopantothenoylcysteine decarboxylase/phosphopantothenate--cysteine ligase CoaBC [Acholeplasmatales bacterium]|nr:bifunctional phosphopantothenoylcysteine decarboxylase/phosphopantothenate--cysteine ligase CoaBC [Acholeplasmatales bacterium]